jgi:hypothetical protein
MAPDGTSRTMKNQANEAIAQPGSFLDKHLRRLNGYLPLVARCVVPIAYLIFPSGLPSEIAYNNMGAL